MPIPQVIVVGAGPVGATMALLCASKGLRVLLVERKSAPTRHPAAHILNGRSLEIWNEISPGLPATIAAAAFPFDHRAQITWQTALAGETIGAVAIFDDEAMLARARSHSRWRTTHLGQHKLEPILWEQIRAAPLIEFQTGATCLEVRTNDAHGVEAVVECRGEQRRHRASYLISAEGASASLRDRVGIAMTGEMLAGVASVFFHARLPDGMEETLPILTWIFNGEIAGPVIRHGDGDWILMTFHIPSVQSLEDLTDAWWLPRIRAAVGVETPITIKSKGVWAMTSELADTYRAGGVFLVGDAAHRFPPTGGYGLNVGVADAHNLAWKLASVLAHGAADALLDTYETERRPVAKLKAEQSVHNHRQMDLVNRHLGVRNAPLRHLDILLGRAPARWIPRRLRRAFVESLARKGLQQVARKLSPANTKRPALLRAMDVDIQKQQAHFSGIGLEYGDAYTRGFVVPEAGPKPVHGDGIRTYRPTTWPGARLPYALLAGAHPTTSTHDALSRDHLTLLVAPPDAHRWSERVAALGDRPFTIEVRSIELQDPEQWRHALETGPGGAILVRPDGHVAWRCRTAADAVAWPAAILALEHAYRGATRQTSSQDIGCGISL